MFGVLDYGPNEYGENIMQHFSSSDHHRQLEIVLRRLKSCDLRPSFAFSNIPDQDRHLLERIFLSLITNLECHEPSDENTSSLPILPLTGSITCPSSIESMITTIYILDYDINDDPDSKNMVVSIDFEWPIYDFGRVKGKISVAQIGANLSNDERHCLVLPFGCHINNRQLLMRLQQLLARVDVVFIGRMIANDSAKLKKTIRAFIFSYQMWLILVKWLFMGA